ncbi:protein phosphatase CheZ [Pelomonas sp. V22]|uniref:protein phosphatase CheZ n=1 Tax=Pelomonas sp. V22 TaxID=2822139 RepID=UPI0024A99ACB|nr:protein phosphatase CheZ [Pelomonas sp. V22]MDI4635797.1 protein phosphatase CheZ [Pelomonas sp. V22]
MSTPLPLQPIAFEQLGHLARTLHEALRELGYDRTLTQVTREIPDARDRLVYVGKLTEDAAHKVLETVEKGMPECDSVAARGRELAETLRRRSEGEMSELMARAMLKQCADYAERAARFADGQSTLLSDIMMTQTYQDLSGQVIKKVVDIITRTEAQLLAILIETSKADPEHPPEVEQLAGPQVPDKALKQDDVDDLLASLGF